MQIEKKAKEFVQAKNIYCLNKDYYLVTGYRDKYSVFFTKDKQSCTCKHFSIHCKMCSHIKAVELFKEGNHATHGNKNNDREN